MIRKCNSIVITLVDILNIGNVFLCFTFARQVIGPDIGNIGEVLKITGNPVYDTKNIYILKEEFELNNNCDSMQQGKINAK